ncbi:hypothetical protein QQF64_033916 [Cirrhinus molitorella]|uniref:Uncharacterized protein n=2 Tax=Cirrhinus molitorella TaxID=172907 RepID=A0ABR3MV81_9TELE|nr:hypothetical protein Q8A67_007270 [Cirrhinus molitorella]
MVTNKYSDMLHSLEAEGLLDISVVEDLFSTLFSQDFRQTWTPLLKLGIINHSPQKAVEVQCSCGRLDLCTQILTNLREMRTSKSQIWTGM